MIVLRFRLRSSMLVPSSKFDKVCAEIEGRSQCDGKLLKFLLRLKDF